VPEHKPSYEPPDPIPAPRAAPARRGLRRRYAEPMHARPALARTVGLILDICAVLAFVAIGRHTHHDGDNVAGLWQTAWPFLAGLAIGLVAVRSWRAPLALVPSGLGAWLGAAGAGMIIRVLAGQGTAAAFIVVALAFLGLFLLGWRVVVRIVTTQLQATH
jgi:Protein of unknown function (DUF3054)